jgi:hypothetical protein
LGEAAVAEQQESFLLLLREHQQTQLLFRCYCSLRELLRAFVCIASNALPSLQAIL